MRALLVDDERLARLRMRQLLRAHSGVEIAGEAADVQQAVRLLEREPVDVVFLDIRMPGGSGLSLFELIDVRARVVFVTAFDRYAVQAFEVGALDYLVKPVDPERLALTLSRLEEGGLRTSLPGPSQGERLCLMGRRGLQLVAASEVVSIRGAGDYSEVLLADGETYLSGTRLYEWEERLAGFFRVHRQVLVNLARVRGLRRQGDVFRLELAGGGEPVDVARRRLAELRAALKL
jgi:two-component system LytT family response regulator